jgi:phosphoserine phosphatase
MPIVIWYKIGMISRERMKFLAVSKFNRLFTGMTRKELNHFFQQVHEQMRGYYNPVIVETIKRAKKQGFHTVLLSGAYMDLLQLVAQELEFDTVIGAELNFKNEVFDHQAKANFIQGPVKYEFLRRAFLNQDIDWESSCSYADSYDDLSVMDIVGKPVAVNPEPRLLEHAQKNNWQII